MGEITAEVIWAALVGFTLAVVRTAVRFAMSPEGRVVLVGNTALAGACGLLLCADARRMLERVRACARFVNLGRMAAFDEAFLDQLFLQPMGSPP